MGSAAPQHDRRARRTRRLWWATAIAFVLLMAPFAVTLVAPNAVAQSSAEQANPRAEYWRAVRESAAGYTAASGPYTTNVLIQNGGENWREIRNNGIAEYGGWLFAAAIVGIALFFFYRGRIRIEAGRSDKRVPRFTLFDRTIHWFMVALVVILGLTGLFLLYGRSVLIPVIGKEAFATVAAASVQAHNLFGPIFIGALVALFINFLRGNMPAKGDLQWLLKGGGMIKGKHASSGRYNAGEKIWFWVASICGLVLAVSGLVLDFPVFGQTREMMQISDVFHGVAAVIFLAGMLAHAYIGTIGMEGSLESMTRGSVDANWAKEHHDLWYAEMEKAGKVLPAAELEGYRREQDLERIPAAGKSGG